MIINNHTKIAITCEKCGRINIEDLNLFEVNLNKEVKFICSCGHSNCKIYFNKNININTNCIYCGKEHGYICKSKDIIIGTEIICPEVNIPIVKVGNKKDINSYIKNTDKNTVEVLYDEDFALFFNNHNIMKKSLEKIMLLKENNKINCNCGNEDIALEVYSDRVELRCIKCQSIKIIYAESQEDLDTFCQKKKINMRQFEFEFIDAANNSDHK